MFGFSVFPMFDSHSGLSFIRLQFYSFSIIRIAIPNFDFQIFGTFRIHVSIFHLSICLFSFSEIWFPISGVRFTSVWHFQSVFHFVSSRLSEFTFIVFWYSMSIFLISDVHSEMQEEVPSSPKKQTEPAQTNPKPSGLILSVPARGYFLPKLLNSFKPTFSRLWGFGTSRPL